MGLQLRYTVSSFGRTALVGEDPETDSATAVAVFGTTFVVVGSVERLAHGTVTGSDAAAWVSRDGALWHRAPASADLADAAMTAVAVVGNQLVAVGCAVSEQDLCTSAAAWTSPDGLKWQRASVAPGSSDIAVASMLAVAATTRGVVAAGYEASFLGEGASPAIWRSADGRTWTQEALDPAIIGPDVREGVFGLGRAWSVAGSFAVAESVGSAANSWTSPDGVTWAPSGLAFSPVSISHAASGYIGVGETGEDGNPPQGGAFGIWASPDGLTWQAVRGTGLGAWLARCSAEHVGPMIVAHAGRFILAVSGGQDPVTGNDVSKLATLDLDSRSLDAAIQVAMGAPPHPAARLTGLVSNGRVVVAVGNEYGPNGRDVGMAWSTTLP